MKSRRLFLKSLFSLPFLSLFNLKSKANTTTKNVLLNQCPVAGFQYYQGKELIKKLKEKDQLKLVAEPDNQYDKYAVEVFFQNKKLGYIPRTDNKPISRMLQAGVPLSGQVCTIDPTKMAWNAVNVSVYMMILEKKDKYNG